MGQPAARITDMHTCPMVTGTVPHVGGPILPAGAPTVLIGGLPAARVGDMATCVGPPDTIIKGSATVFIGGMPAARMGDTTAHCGVIVVGCPTVLIGDGGAAGASVVCSMPVSPVEEEGWWDSWGSDVTHGILDVAGLVPLIGEAADGANVLIYTAEGDAVNAAISAAAMIPFVGMGATVGKIGIKAEKIIAKETTETLVEKTVVEKVKLNPGSPEHKTDRWNKYQQKEGKLDYDEWGKKYDTAISNKINGDRFSIEETRKFKEQADKVETQISIKTKDGTKTVVDAIGVDKNGEFIIQEHKSSSTATLTKNQERSFPQIEKSGGTVVGNGKGFFKEGAEIPPTKIEIIRPPK